MSTKGKKSDLVNRLEIHKSKANNSNNNNDLSGSDEITPPPDSDADNSDKGNNGSNHDVGDSGNEPTVNHMNKPPTKSDADNSHNENNENVEDEKGSFNDSSRSCMITTPDEADSKIISDILVNNDKAKEISNLPFDESSSSSSNGSASSATIPSINPMDDDLSETDNGKENSNRFNFVGMNESILSLCKCLDNVSAISDLSCSVSVGKVMVEFEENDLATLFNLVNEKNIFDTTTTFLDIGSGMGMPQFILWHLHKIPSHGFEISPFYTKVALQSLISVKEMKSDEDVKVTFSCLDVKNIKSLNPYNIIFSACSGYVSDFFCIMITHLFFEIYIHLLFDAVLNFCVTQDGPYHHRYNMCFI